MDDEKAFLKPIGDRLIAVRKELGFPNRESFAEAYGSPKKTFEKYEQGKSELPTRLLQWLHVVHRVDLTWLMSGDGAMFEKEQQARDAAGLPEAVDPVLMEDLYKAVERAYREAGQRPPGHRLANDATALFNVLLSRVRDIRDKPVVDAVIPILAGELVEKLIEAQREPGTGKASGSSS